MTYPAPYSNKRPPIVANYQLTDVAQGRGILNLYCGDVQIPAGIQYIMSSNTWNSAAGVTKNSGSSHFTNNFNIVFSRPINFRGTCLFELPVYATSGGTTNCTITLNKIHNAITTQLFTTSGSNAQASPGASVCSIQKALASTIHFAANDTLQLQVDTYASGTGGDSYTFYDPANRSSFPNTTTTTFAGLTTSQMKLQMPVKLDIGST